MATRYHTLQCQHCGIDVLRAIWVKIATCIVCKMKIDNDKEKSPEGKIKRKESRRRRNSSP